MAGKMERSIEEGSRAAAWEARPVREFDAVRGMRCDRNAVADYMQQAVLLDRRIDAGFERIMQLRALAERRTAVYGREGSRGGGSPDGRMDVVARIVDAERELDEQIDRMIALKREIAGVIARVPDERMRNLLELRYLNGHTWEEVAERMHYTTRNVYNLHNAALKALAILVPSNALDLAAGQM